MFRAGTSSAVRVERIDKIASYSSSLDFLTRFYNQKAGRPKLNELDSNEIDLTGESDDDGLDATDDDNLAKTENLAKEPPQGGNNSIDLAAGLPGELPQK